MFPACCFGLFVYLFSQSKAWERGEAETHRSMYRASYGGNSPTLCGAVPYMISKANQRVEKNGGGTHTQLL